MLILDGPKFHIHLFGNELIEKMVCEEILDSSKNWF